MGMEEVLLVAAVIGGIAWWMHGGQTPAQAQPVHVDATQVEHATPAAPASPAPAAPANPSK